MLSSQNQPAHLTISEIHRALQSFDSKQADSPGQSWLKSLTLQLDDSANVLKVFFPHAFFAEWFKSHLQNDFEAFLLRRFPALQTFSYHAHNGQELPVSLHRYTPDPRFSFSNFLYNKKNYLPYMSALELSKTRRISSNPFLLLGESGAGKSHLLRAIANQSLQDHPGKTVGLFTADELNFLYRTKIKSNQALRNELYAFDVFILEDIQQLELYPKLQEQLIYVIDSFLESTRQMLFSCAESLNELDFINPTLRSRLESGLIVQLKRPDLDVRLEYVQRESVKHGLSLNQEQMLTVARRCFDFQSLYRTVIRLTVHCQLGGHPPGDKQFTRLIQETKEESLADPDLDSITDTVCTYFQVDREALFSGKRTKELVLARQVAMYLGRSLLNLPYVTIGAFFGGKDHSTVIHSVKKIKQSQNSNQTMKSMLKELKNRCRHREQP